MHSRLYEGDRLDGLLRHRGLSELAGDLLPMETFASHAALERRLVERYAESLALLWRFLDSPRDRLFAVLALRLQIENVKVVLRSRLAGRDVATQALPVIPMPEAFRWDDFDPSKLETVQSVLDAIPEPAIRRSACDAYMLFADRPVPLYLEAGLDRGYFALLADAAAELGNQDRRAIQPLLEVETDLHRLMLVLRARVNHGIDPALVARLVAAPPAAWVAAAAEGDSVDGIVRCAPGPLRRHLAEGPAELPDIERRLWQAYYATANRVYRQAFFTVGCPYAFAAVKRMELANLITVVESVRYGLSADETLKHLLRPAA